MRGARFDFREPPRSRWVRDWTRSADCQTTTGHVAANCDAADPDERRAPGLRSLAESAAVRLLLELIELSRRGPEPLVHQRLRRHAVEVFNVLGCPRRLLRRRGTQGGQPGGSGLGSEVFALGQHRPGHARVLRCNGHHRLPVAAPLGQSHRPAAQTVSLARRGCQHRSRAHDQQRA